MLASRSSRRLRVLAVFASLSAFASTASAQSMADVDSPRVQRLFSERVEDYAALHRRLEASLPPLTSTRNILKNYIAQQLLASAIRKARHDAGQGDVFSAEIAAGFRRLIRDALRLRDVDAFLAELQWEHPDVYNARPVVNEPLPAAATHEMPVILLQVLPALPEDLEYRIVNHDLVLWDLHASIVVDFLPDAFRPIETTRSDVSVIDRRPAKKSGGRAERFAPVDGALSQTR